MSLNMPDDWRRPFEGEAALIEAQLLKEIGPGHVLEGQPLELIARRYDQDDVLIAVGNGQIAQVHMTWRGSPEPNPKWPRTETFQDLDTWLALQP